MFKVLDARILPNYAYRDDAMLLHKAIEAYVGKVIRHYYGKKMQHYVGAIVEMKLAAISGCG